MHSFAIYVVCRKRPLKSHILTLEMIDHSWKFYGKVHNFVLISFPQIYIDYVNKFHDITMYVSFKYS